MYVHTMYNCRNKIVEDWTVALIDNSPFRINSSQFTKQYFKSFLTKFLTISQICPNFCLEVKKTI